MEEVYKKGSKYFGMSSGLMYPKDEVQEINGSCWHGHGVGTPVIEVAEIDKDTRLHHGYPQYPSKSGNSKGGY